MRLLSKLALLLAAAAMLPAATIQLTPSTATVGQTFTVTVSATGLGGDLVAAFGFNPFISDPARATFVSALVDPLFFDDFAFPGSPAVVGLWNLNDPGATDPVTLATLTFLALQTGPVSVGLMTDPLDPNQGIFLLGPVLQFPSTAPASVSVDVMATPEPAAAGLLALGIGAIWFRRRRSA